MDQKKPLVALPAIPLNILDSLDKLEEITRKKLENCTDFGQFNLSKAKQTLRSTAARGLILLQSHYGLLPNFGEHWQAEIEQIVIDRLLGALPDSGLGWDEELRSELHRTIQADAHAHLQPEQKRREIEKGKPMPSVEAKSKTVDAERTVRILAGKPASQAEPPSDASIKQSATETHANEQSPTRLSKTDEITRRAELLTQYKAATGQPSNRKLYTAKNSGIHKPEFFAWVKGELPATSQTCINFERFLREKKPPVPRKPKG